MKTSQLILAAKAVTRKTPEPRRRLILRKLAEVRNPPFEIRALSFYLANPGSVPQSLWG